MERKEKTPSDGYRKTQKCSYESSYRRWRTNRRSQSLPAAEFYGADGTASPPVWWICLDRKRSEQEKKNARLHNEMIDTCTFPVSNQFHTRSENKPRKQSHIHTYTLGWLAGGWFWFTLLSTTCPTLLLLRIFLPLRNESPEAVWVSGAHVVCDASPVSILAETITNVCVCVGWE